MSISRLAISIGRTILAVILLSYSAGAQIALGTWQSHLPHKVGLSVTETPESIIYSTGLDLISLDKSDLSAQYISTVDGLSGTDINIIEYDPIHDQLIILYADGGIDIMLVDGSIRHIPNIKENTSIPGDKTISSIHITDDGLILLVTGFGMIELDGGTLRFGATVITDVAVTDVTSVDRTVYLATDEGLYAFDRSIGRRISDFGQWEYLSDGSYGLPPLVSVDGVSGYAGRPIAVVDHMIYRQTGGMYEEWISLPDDGLSFSFLEKSGERHVVGYTDGAGQSQIYIINADGSYQQPDAHCTGVTRDALIDDLGRIWYGDEYRPIRYATSMDGACQELDFDSPYHQSVSDIEIYDGHVYVASGGVSDNYQYTFSREGFYINNENGWQNYNEYTQPWIGDFDLINLHRLLPTEDKVYIASYWAGLLEYNPASGERTIYDDRSSSLSTTVGDEERVRVTGMALDASDNLWVSLFGARRPLCVRTLEDKWDCPPINSRTQLTDAHIDDYGHLWCPIYSISGEGILLFDPGDDPTDRQDNRQRVLTMGNSALPSNLIRSVANDREGLVWVGTARGPVVFDPADDLLVADQPGLRVKVVEDGIPAFLLADQDIRAIAVDGADRKWFGTTNGIFVQSADGREKVARYTTDNSPLYDNLITDLAFDGESGIMYIGTARGLLSYQTYTTDPTTRHRSSDVIVYPNPVRPDYDGLIGITGLIEDAIVQITDMRGRLIYETRALGGHATWDGRDIDDQPVASGVYYIYSTNGNTRRSPDGYVTKVMIIR